MKITALALASGLFVVGALAQTAPQPMAVSAPAAKADASAVRHEARVERHVSDLHDRLKVSASEEAQWNSVAQSMRESAEQLDAAIEQRDSHRKAATALEDLNAYAVLAQAHADGVKKLATAFAPLYAAMGDDQKKLADAVFSQRTHKAK